MSPGELRKEAAAVTASPYRQALYICAREKMRYTKEQAAKAAKELDHKVVRRFESGR